VLGCVFDGVVSHCLVHHLSEESAWLAEVAVGVIGFMLCYQTSDLVGFVPSFGVEGKCVLSFVKRVRLIVGL